MSQLHLVPSLDPTLAFPSNLLPNREEGKIALLLDLLDSVKIGHPPNSRGA